jgi:hypothetical protein
MNRKAGFWEDAHHVVWSWESHDYTVCSVYHLYLSSSKQNAIKFYSLEKYYKILHLNSLSINGVCWIVCVE